MSEGQPGLEDSSRSARACLKTKNKETTLPANLKQILLNLCTKILRVRENAQKIAGGPRGQDRACVGWRREAHTCLPAPLGPVEEKMALCGILEARGAQGHGAPPWRISPLLLTPPWQADSAFGQRVENRSGCRHEVFNTPFMEAQDSPPQNNPLLSSSHPDWRQLGPGNWEP